MGASIIQKKNYMKAINLFWVALKYGSLFIKIKSLIKLFKASINKVTDKIIKTVLKWKKILLY